MRWRLGGYRHAPASLPGSVHVCPVADPNHEDDPVGGVKLKQHPVVTATDRTQSIELPAQWLTQPLRVRGKGAGDELDDRGRDPRRESVDVASYAGADLYPPRRGRRLARFSHPGARPRPSRSCSPLVVLPSPSSRRAAPMSSRTPGWESQ